MSKTPIPAEGMSTALKHTPGNWHTDGPCLYSNLPDGSLVRVADFTPAEEDGHLIPEGQEEANAALCALAPAMKDALQACLAALGYAADHLAVMKPLSGIHASSLRADQTIITEVADQVRSILSTLNQTKTA